MGYVLEGELVKFNRLEEGDFLRRGAASGRYRASHCGDMYMQAGMRI